jgi:acyl transferase domain-containing protein
VQHQTSLTCQVTGGAVGVRFGGFCDGIDRFDADALRMSPAEAAATDPQQRLLLELALLTMADAGAAPAAPTGTTKTHLLAYATACCYSMLG